MTKAAQDLLKDALALPEAERAELAAELLGSLDGPPAPTDDEAWIAELRRRADAAASGEDPGEPWDVVRARIEASLDRP